MFEADDELNYLERAEMHERLAASTGDLPARKMHEAMAAEYRRRAAQAKVVKLPPMASLEPLAKLSLQSG